MVIFSGWVSLVLWFAGSLIIIGFVLATSAPARNGFVDQYFDVRSSYNIYEYLLAFSVIGVN